MIVDVTMPRLSDTMTEGYVATWYKAVGDRVVQGEDLCDIDTDKATVTHESPASGVVTELLVEDEETEVAVGAPIARIQVDA
jgi:pyruvate/2-oxoglutarate dehydrogenase complex dihydrolipoamide acyltransferase (E2) component